MKIGINHWTFPDQKNVRGSFAVAKRAGCDHIELNLAESGELSLESSEEQVRALAQEATLQGVEISSLSTSLYGKFCPTNNDTQVRKSAVSFCEKHLQVARWLGVDTILVVPGRVTADVSYDIAYERATEFVRAVLPAAKREGVTLAIENVWNKFLLSPLEMRTFIDSFNDASVGVYFDAGNILTYGFPQHWIRILGPRIKKIHVKDFDEKIGGYSGFRNLLQGGVPWNEVRVALHEIGYNGHITAEVSGYRVHPELGLKHIVEAMRAVFGEELA